MNCPPQARNYINSLSHMPKRNFADVFIGANPQGKKHQQKAAVLGCNKLPCFCRSMYALFLV